ncbi:phage repressor protein CI [Pantoea ananatis]|uniref:phage repressor protein CI n=1 Tax=Pantoea ananas TaxID=553 RepID=UPI0010592215|nr:phage repressor protein CI [Pantoea ananatis]TDL50769.1 phage repressor protein [Pantoea ananatis]
MRSIKVGNDSGGRDAINRLIEAYNFSTRQQLCDHLSVSKSTMANRYLRDSFPAEWIIQCALETGVSLLWLATGQGEKDDHQGLDKKGNGEPKGSYDVNPKRIKPLSKIIAPEIDKLSLKSGELIEDGKVILDSSLIPAEVGNPAIVEHENSFYLIDRNLRQLVNGLWLINIDEINSLARLSRLPGNRLIVEQGSTSFECSIDDIEVLGRALSTIKSI